MKKQMNWKGKEQLVQFNSKFFIHKHVRVHGSVIVSVRAAALLVGPGPFCVWRDIFFQRGNLKGGRSKEITALEGNKRTEAGQGNVGAL